MIFLEDGSRTFRRVFNKERRKTFMHVVLFSIGKFTVYTYGMMIAIGVILAVLVVERRTKKQEQDADAVFMMAVLALIFGFLGAKILYILQNWRSFLESPASVLGSSGFLLFGGIVLGVLAVILYCRARHLSFLRYFDLMMPSVSLAQAFGRIGCFFAGCCYGKETDAWWGITFTESTFAPNGVSLIPTQLISAAGNFLIMLALLLFAKRAKKVGDVGALYLVLYGAGRFCVEFLRENQHGWVGPLTTDQVFSLVCLAAGIILFIRNHKSREAESYGEEKMFSIWLQ